MPKMSQFLTPAAEIPLMTPREPQLKRRPTRASADSRPATSSSQWPRVEVCPPELWPSSATWLGRLRRWWQRGGRWVPAAMRPSNRLAQVKADFHLGLDGVEHWDADALSDRIERARSLRELWHLRSTLYTVLAQRFDQAEAERRLAALNRHFPQRVARPGGVAWAD